MPPTKLDLLAAASADTARTEAEQGTLRLSYSGIPTPAELAEARRQYDEVVARYTNPDGTKKPGWKKAPNGKPTRLTERQWVQVRTPNFRNNFFGDWLSLALRDAIEATEPIDFERPVDGELLELVEGYRRGDAVTEKKIIEWAIGQLPGGPISTPIGPVTISRGNIRSILHHAQNARTRGPLKVLTLPYLARMLEKAVLYDERADGPDYFYNFAHRISFSGVPYIARIIVKREADGGITYDTEFTEEKKLSGALATRTGAPAEAETAPARPTTDTLLKALYQVNPSSVSKVVDENGEPLVVWHGSHWDPLAEEPGKAVFDFTRADSTRGMWWGAGNYFSDTKAGAEWYGRARAYFLNLRNPLDLRTEDGRLFIKEIAVERGMGDNAIARDIPPVVLTKTALRRGFDGFIAPATTTGNIEFVEFNQDGTIKSATDNTGVFSARPDVRYSVSGLYTGSAADYAERVPVLDKDGNVTGYRIDNAPSLQHVGTGEGSQVYGWGLYASDQRGVAEGYARAARDEQANRLHENGRLVRVDGMAGNVPYARLQAYQAIESALWGDRRIKTKAGLLGRLRKSDLSPDAMEEAERLIAENDYNIPRASTYIYEQTFFTDRAPGDESHLLKWYEEVPRDIFDRIVSALKEEGRWGERDGGRDILGRPETIYGTLYGAMRHSGGEWTGGDVYELVRAQLGADENHGAREASEFLARAGIDGVKYPVDSFGGKGVKDGDEAGWNYVTFRDDNIRVDHKWVDGEQRYSVTAAEILPHIDGILNGAVKRNGGNAVDIRGDKDAIRRDARRIVETFASERIPLSTGGVLFFAPDEKTVLAYGGDMEKAWAEYAIHLATHDQTGKDGVHYRTYERSNLKTVLPKLREVVKTDKVKLERGAVVFYQESRLNHYIRVVTNPVGDGDLRVDLAYKTGMERRGRIPGQTTTLGDAMPKGPAEGTAQASGRTGILPQAAPEVNPPRESFTPIGAGLSNESIFAGLLAADYVSGKDRGAETYERLRRALHVEDAGTLAEARAYARKMAEVRRYGLAGRAEASIRDAAAQDGQGADAIFGDAPSPDWTAEDYAYRPPIRPGNASDRTEFYVNNFFKINGIFRENSVDFA